MVKKNKLTTYVAYVLRFHPVIEALKKELKKGKFCHMRVWTGSYLPQWRKGIDHKKRYSANREMGGGVMLDLSHELDYTQYLLGPIETLAGQYGKRSNVTVDSEDYADFLIKTKKGPVNIHMNFLSHLKERKIQIDLQDRSVEADLIHNTLAIYREGRLIKKQVFKETMEDAFLKQLNYFFNNLKNPRMMNNAVEAATLFKKICDFKTLSFPPTGRQAC